MNNINKDKDNNFFVKSILALQSKIYISLYVLETTLKEQLVVSLHNKLGKDWLAEELKKENTLVTNEITLIHQRKKKEEVISENELITFASLGFWIEMFSRSIYRELKGAPIKAFKNLPPQIKRKQIHSILQEVKTARNELYHHRIIINYKKTDDIARLEKFKNIERDIRTVITYLDPDRLELLPNDFLEAYHKLVEEIEDSYKVS